MDYHPTASNRQVDKYAHRQELNRASRSWAKRDGEAWTADEDAFLHEFWIDVEARDRDEVTVSQALERTIEACRVRCEHIRKALGIQTCTRVVRITVEVELCPSCFTVMPHTGSCDYCA